MKSSLEKVNVITTRHKEPTPLDLYTLFHLTDNNVRDRMLKENNTIPSLHLYSRQSQMTTTYLVHPKNENPTCILEAMFQIMNGEDEFDYYIIVYEGWRNRNEIPEKYKHGDVAKLSIDKRQETLIINGKSKDGKESLTILYDIVRINPEDDNSRIIRFEKFFEGNEGRTRAELTVKRKWFSSTEEMFQSMESQTSDNHEVHCCVQGSEVVGSGILKHILIMHRNHDTLHDSVEQLVGEEILAFRKERNCFNTSVLRSLQFTLHLLSHMSGGMFALVLSISLVEDYNGDFYYRTLDGKVDKLLVFEHRDDDDYRSATPIKEEVLNK